MNVTKKLIFALAAGTTLVAAAPVFADQGHERERDYRREPRYYQRYDRDDRDDYRGYHRGWERRRFVVVQRPVVVERPAYPVYYAPPAPAFVDIGPATLIGAVIGGYIDSRQ